MVTAREAKRTRKQITSPFRRSLKVLKKPESILGQMEADIQMGGGTIEEQKERRTQWDKSHPGIMTGISGKQLKGKERKAAKESLKTLTGGLKLYEKGLRTAEKLTKQEFKEKLAESKAREAAYLHGAKEPRYLGKESMIIILIIVLAVLIIGAILKVFF